MTWLLALAVLLVALVQAVPLPGWAGRLCSVAAAVLAGVVLVGVWT